MSIRSEATAVLDPIFEGRVTADEVPKGGLGFPYCRFIDNITENDIMRGDARSMASRRTVQVDVYQTLEDETDDIVDRVRDNLDGHAAQAGLRFVWTNTVRLPDNEANLVQHSLDFGIVRLRST